MRQASGFKTIIASNVLTPQAQSSLNRLYQLQDTVLTSDHFSNQVVEIPTTQEEFSNIKNIINIVTGIKEHLDECCDKIKLLLRDLKIQVRDVYKNLRSVIVKSTNAIKVDIKLFKNFLVGFYNTKKGKLVD